MVEDVKPKRIAQTPSPEPRSVNAGDDGSNRIIDAPSPEARRVLKTLIKEDKK